MNVNDQNGNSQAITQGFFLKTQLQQDTGALIETDREKLYRRLYHYTASNEILNNIAYSFFQYNATYAGLMLACSSYKIPQSAVKSLSILLVSCDFLNNILAFNPANDAVNWLHTTRPKFKYSTTQYLFNLALGISIIGSYIPGATPGCTQLLKYLPHNLPIVYFALIAAIFSLLTIPSGTAYYIGSHEQSMYKTFEAFETWKSKPKLSGIFCARTLEATRKIITIFLYRATIFAFFTLDFLEAIRIQNKKIFYLVVFFSLATFFCTIINVLATRFLYVIEEMLHPKFCGIDRAMFKLAEQDFYQKFSLNSTRLHQLIFSVTACLLISVGYGLISFALLSHILPSTTNNIVSSILALSVLCTSLYAQWEATIYHYATHFIQHYNTEQQNLLSPTEISLSQNHFTDKRILLRACFSWLAERQHSSTLHYGITTLTILARFSRIFGAYFIETRINTFFGLNLSSVMLIGLYLAFVPDNMMNEFDFFKNANIETISNKAAEAQVAKNNKSSSKTTELIFNYFLIYNRSYIDYSSNDVTICMENEIEKMTPRKTNV